MRESEGEGGERERERDVKATKERVREMRVRVRWERMTHRPARERGREIQRGEGIVVEFFCKSLAGAIKHLRAAVKDFFKHKCWRRQQRQQRRLTSLPIWEQQTKESEIFFSKVVARWRRQRPLDVKNNHPLFVICCQVAV